MIFFLNVRNYQLLPIVTFILSLRLYEMDEVSNEMFNARGFQWNKRFFVSGEEEVGDEGPPRSFITRTEGKWIKSGPKNEVGVFEGSPT